MWGKRGFEFSFAWLFALLVGVIILFLAIYGTINLINTQKFSGQTETAKQLTIIFNPMETGLAEGIVPVPVSFNVETRLFNDCSSEGSFGSEQFSVSQRTGLIKSWPKPGAPISLNNKFVFSNDSEQGKIFYFFSKPFEMPFKVSEMIFMSTASYCFVDAPEFIKEEVSNLHLQNVMIENCTGKEARVCFGSSCEISVYGDCSSGLCNSEYDYGYIEKQGTRIYYTGGLIYAGVFSSPGIYSCNFKRLMLRTQQIAYLYSDEASYLGPVGCGQGMIPGLVGLAQAAKSADPLVESSLVNLRQAADSLDNENSAAGGCKIYG